MTAAAAAAKVGVAAAAAHVLLASEQKSSTITRPVVVAHLTGHVKQARACAAHETESRSYVRSAAAWLDYANLIQKRNSTF